MTNIPTDLLRTLVAVVDLRSFTKAANSLGVTQPAVSAQIKRLQQLVGFDLFDRNGQSMMLTSHGERVVARARRLLSLNDEIVELGNGGARPEVVVRIGTPSQFVASVLVELLAQLRSSRPDVRFAVRSEFHEPLVRQLHSDEIDLMISLSPGRPHDARHCQEQEMVWVRGPTTGRLDGTRPVPLVSYGDQCLFQQHAVRTLRKAGLDHEQVFIGPSMHSLANAVAAGLGYMVFTRQRASAVGMTIWDDTPLPKPDPLYSIIATREGGAREIYEQLADDIAAVIHGPPEVQARLYSMVEGGRKVSAA
jgi:DNA-binding transcriptional LysR family regulator